MNSKLKKQILCLLLSIIIMVPEFANSVMAVNNSLDNKNNTKVEQKSEKINESVENEIKSLKDSLRNSFKAETTIENIKEDKSNTEKSVVENKTIDANNKNENDFIVSGNSNSEDSVVITPDNSTIEEPKKLTRQEYYDLKSSIAEDNIEKQNIKSELKDIVENNKDSVVKSEDKFNNESIKNSLNKSENLEEAKPTTKRQEKTSKMENKINILNNLVDSSDELDKMKNNTSKSVNVQEYKGYNTIENLVTTGAPAVEPEKENKIGNISVDVKWLENNVEINDITKTLDWTNGSTDVRARINYKIQGSKENYAPGTVEIEIPKQIFRDREGNLIGDITLGAPRFPNNMQPIAYIEKEDKIVFVNTRELNKNTTAYVEVTFKASSTEKVKDLATGYASDELYANLTVRDNIGNEKTDLCQKGNKVNVNTKASINSANGIDGYPYEVYPGNFPSELKPDNSGNYVYSYITTWVNYDATQPFKLDYIANTNVFGGKVLGIKTSRDGKVFKNTSNGQSMTQTIREDGSYSEGGTRIEYITVYTAYPIENFTESKTYSLVTNAEYKMIATDDKEVTSGKTSQTVPYTPIRFKANDAHFRVDKHGHGKNRRWTGLKYEGVYEYYLNKILKGDSVDIEYRTIVTAFNMPFTFPDWNPDEKNQNDDLDQYKQKKFTLELEDNILKSPEYSNDDFDLKSIRFENLRLYDYGKYPDNGYGYFEDAKRDLKYGYIPVGNYGYISKNNIEDLVIADKSYTFEVIAIPKKGEGTVVASANITNGAISLTAKNGASVENNNLVFPKGTKQYKVVFNSGIPGYTFDVYPKVEIKSNEKTKDIADKELQRDVPNSRIRFDSKLKGITENGVVLNSRPDYGYDNLMGVMQGLRTFSEMSYTNDPESARVNVQYTLKTENQTNITDKSILDEVTKLGILKDEVEQTWYDLLPEDFDINLNTIRVNGNGSIKDVKLERNYNNSGRDLLVVKSTHKPDYKIKFGDSSNNKSILGIDGYCDTPSISFNGYYTWMNMENNSIKTTSGGKRYNLKNSIAYESVNEDIGLSKGYLGEDGTASDKRNKYTKFDENLKNVVDKKDKNSNLYHILSSDINVDKQMSTGLYKFVDVNNNNSYTTGTLASENKNVYENGYYKYRISLVNDNKTKSKNVVFYDILDDAILDEKSGLSEFKDKRWKGKLNDVNVTSLEKEGIEPVAYYSTSKNLKPEDNLDLTNGNIWTKVKPSDLSKVTAVAIDASKKKDGSQFVLEEDKSLTIEIQMKAPSHNEETKDKFAFNRSTVKFNFYEDIEGKDKEKLESNLTKVGLKPFYIQVNHSWDDDNNRDGLRPNSIEVELVKNGKLTGQKLTLDNTNKWSGIIKNVEYQDKNGKVNNYTLKTNKLTDYDFNIGSPELKEDRLELNSKHIHEPYRIDISGKKLWEGDGGSQGEDSKRPTSITLKLYANDVENSTISVVPDKEGNWNYAFKNVYKNENGKEINYDVKEYGYIEGYSPAKYQDTKKRIIVNKYYPFGDLKIEKEIIDTTKEAKTKSFKFKVEIFDKKGGVDTGEYEYTTQNGFKDKVSTGGYIELKPLKDGSGVETATIKDIPSKNKVSITEEDVKGFTTPNKTKDSNVIRSGRETVVKFDNKYDTSGRLILKGTKKLDGSEMRPYFFLFDLIEYENGKEGKVLQTVRNDSKGDIYFEPIEYGLKDINKETGLGTKTYILKERNDNKQGYKYDTSVTKVEVSLKDNGDGTITVIPKYFNGNTEVNSIIFSNTYSAKGDLNISFNKRIKNTPEKPKDKEFKFKLYSLIDGKETEVTGSDGKPLEASNNNLGEVDFSIKEKYTQKDIGKKYQYVVRESVYDKNVYKENNDYLKFEVTVKDNKDGTLSTTTNYLGRFDKDNKKVNSENETAPELVNTRVDGSLTLSKKWTGETENPDKSKQFTFKIKFTGDKELIPEKLTGKVRDMNNCYDQMCFEGEVTGNQLGITYDNIYDNMKDKGESKKIPASVLDDVTGAEEIKAQYEKELANGGVWLKFTDYKPEIVDKNNGKPVTFYVSKKPIVNRISWNNIKDSGMLYGPDIVDEYGNRVDPTGKLDPNNELNGYKPTILTSTANNTKYQPSLLRGFSNYGDPTTKGEDLYNTLKEDIKNSQWNRTILPITKQYRFGQYTTDKLEDILKQGNTSGGYSSNNYTIQLASYNWFGDLTLGSNQNFKYKDNNDIKGVGDKGQWNWTQEHIHDFGSAYRGSDYFDSGAADANEYNDGSDNTHDLYALRIALYPLPASDHQPTEENTNNLSIMNNPSAKESKEPATLELSDTKLPTNVQSQEDNYTIKGYVNNSTSSENYTSRIDENSLDNTVMDLTNVYKDGLEIIYHSNNGETKTKIENYGPESTLKAKDKFYDNKDKIWGNGDLVIKGWSTVEKYDRKPKTPYYPVGKVLKASGIYDNRDTDDKVNLYAVWGRPDYTIEFNPNGGRGTMAPQTVEYDKNTQLNTNTFYRSGYNFLGWSTDPNATGDKLDYSIDGKIKKSYVEDDKLTLYAIWGENSLEYGSTTGEFEILLREGEEITFEDLPAGLKYEVSEDLSNEPKEYSIAATDNTVGEINPSNKDPKATITNAYNMKTISTTIRGIKTVDNKAKSTDEFKFKLESVSDNAKEVLPNPRIISANNKGGRFEFKDLIFNKPGEYKFKLTEVQPGDPKSSIYTYDTSEKIITVNVTLDKNSGTLQDNIICSDGLVFKNATKTSKLEIKKDSTNKWGLNPKFDFKLYLNGSEIPEPEQISLSNGESFITKELPVGTKYRIEEIGTKGWEKVKNPDMEGEIGLKDVDNPKLITVVNKYKDINETGEDGKINEDAVVKISAKKLIENGKLKGNDFRFELRSTKDENKVYYSMNDLNGNIDFKIPFNDLELKDNTYTLKEIPKDDETIEYDKTFYDISFDMAVNGDGTGVAKPSEYKIKKSEEGQYSTVGVDNTQETLVFKNTVNSGELNISKVIKNGTKAAKSQIFKIKVTSGNVSNEFDLTSEKPVSIKLPVGSTYKVEEINIPDGYKLESIQNGEGTIKDSKTSETVVITNVYDAKVQFTPEVNKKIVKDVEKTDEGGNKNLEKVEDPELLKDYSFRFMMLDDKYNKIGEATNDSNGNVVFPTIEYGVKDIGKTFTYYFRELNDSAYAIVYDKNTYKMEVTVKDETNGLELEKKVYKVGLISDEELKDKDNKNIETINFLNEFKIVQNPITGYKKSIIIVTPLAAVVAIAYLISRKKK